MPDSTIYAVGFSLWKRPHVRAFFQGREVVFVRNPHLLPKRSKLCVATWGMRIAQTAFPANAEIIRVEDGFLRSVGLGADLVRPLSWVRDARGIYYNATGPSDLEHILENFEFSNDWISRSHKLRESLIASELTKYNIGSGEWRRPCGNQRVVLVPGQVESDASIQYGSAGIKTNLDLLKASRAENPGAFIVYKPHPDVVAGLRSKGAGESVAEDYCDALVVDVPMGALLKQVDEVHTLTSLTGFEALLRGMKVVTYGMPFYAGWGLTEDRGMKAETASRRQRRLNLDELVAGTLLLYPTYVSRKTGKFTTAEDALQELLKWRESASGSVPAWRKVLRFLLGCFKY
jgi:capsular polysaccharide export protein